MWIKGDSAVKVNGQTHATHPVTTVNMNAWSKFHDNPSNSSGDISPKITNVNVMEAREEKSRNPQSCQVSSSENHECPHRILCQSMLMLRCFTG